MPLILGLTAGTLRATPAPHVHDQAEEPQGPCVGAVAAASSDIPRKPI